MKLQCKCWLVNLQNATCIGVVVAWVSGRDVLSSKGRTGLNLMLSCRTRSQDQPGVEAMTLTCDSLIISGQRSYCKSFNQQLQSWIDESLKENVDRSKLCRRRNVSSSGALTVNLGKKWAGAPTRLRKPKCVTTGFKQIWTIVNTI